MKISAKETIKQRAWSGTLADLRHLAQRVETILAPAIDEGATNLATNLKAKYDYLDDEDRRRELIEERVAKYRDDRKTTVQLTYGRHAAQHEGTIDELADVEVRDLRAVVISGGLRYDEPRITITLNPEKIETEVHAGDTAFLVSALAQIGDELARFKPAWAGVRAPQSMLGVALLWIAIVVWWCVRLIHPIGAAIPASIVIGLWPVAAVAAFHDALRNKIFPAFEVLNDRGEGSVKTRLRRIAWVASFVVAIISVVPILF
jgi:hypothetical protein